MADAVLYTTLEQEGVAEFVEKKSVFIGHAIPVKSEEEAQAYIKKQKSEPQPRRIRLLNVKVFYEPKNHFKIYKAIIEKLEKRKKEIHK